MQCNKANVNMVYLNHTNNNPVLNLAHFRYLLDCLYMDEVVLSAWLAIYVLHVCYFGDLYNININIHRSTFYVLIESLWV